MREFRTGYFAAPHRADRSGEPGNVCGGIHVAVRQVSTWTDEAMLHPLSKLPTHATSLRCVSGVDVDHVQPSAFGLVGNKVLKLPEGPAMQTRPDPLSGLDVGADVGQVFHPKFTCSGTNSFCDDGLAGFMVHVLDMPLLTTGDSTELTSSSSTTVGLETTAMGKVNVPVMPEFSAAPDLASAGDCEVILAYVNPESATARNRDGIGKIKGEIEVPIALADDQLGFFRCTTGKQVTLVLTADELNLGSPSKSEQRERVALDRVGALIEVDRGCLEGDSRDRFVLGDALVGLVRLVGIGNTVNGLANHLTTKCRKLLAHRVIGQVVQRHPVPATMLDGERHDGIASFGIGVRKRGQRTHLLGCANQLEGYRSRYHIGQYRLPFKESQGHFFPPHPKGRGLSELFL